MTSLRQRGADGRARPTALERVRHRAQGRGGLSAVLRLRTAGRTLCPYNPLPSSRPQTDFASPCSRVCLNLFLNLVSKPCV